MRARLFTSKLGASRRLENLKMQFEVGVMCGLSYLATLRASSSALELCSDSPYELLGDIGFLGAMLLVSYRHCLLGVVLRLCQAAAPAHAAL